MSKFIPDFSLEPSPITKSGEPVMSRSGSAVNDKGEIVHDSYMINGKECVEMLEWINYKMPLLYSTKKLEKAAKDMKEALMEVLEAVND